MKLADITTSIEANDLREIERAYRVLAGYPHEEAIEDADPTNLLAAMVSVTIALAHDHSIMPSETCEAAGLRPGSTYAEGTTDFVANRQWWMRRFQSVMPGH
ncbi:hypothetical protein [Methylobacterium sp. CM6247]